MGGASSLETRHARPALPSFPLGRRTMVITLTLGWYPHGYSAWHSKASLLRGLSATRASTRSILVKTPLLTEIGSLPGQISHDVCASVGFLYCFSCSIIGGWYSAGLFVVDSFIAFYFLLLLVCLFMFPMCRNRSHAVGIVVVTFFWLNRTIHSDCIGKRMYVKGLCSRELVSTRAPTVHSYSKAR